LSKPPKISAWYNGMKSSSPSNSWPRRLELADAEVRRTLQRLPGTLGEEAKAVLLHYERTVRPDQLEDGVEPDTMGLFEGSPYGEQVYSEDSLPPRITLFLDSIWEEADEDEEHFIEEVRVTFLHELGHYLGLNEDELTERHLE
jgi:predicted Zn-dependent protease with MMP-like domain